MKIAYVDNERAPVRQWYRILARLRGDQLHIIVLKNAESEEVLTSIQQVFFAERIRHCQVKFFQYFYLNRKQPHRV